MDGKAPEQEFSESPVPALFNFYVKFITGLIRRGSLKCQG